MPTTSDAKSRVEKLATSAFVRQIGTARDVSHLSQVAETPADEARESAAEKSKASERH